jgi:hypothetical protein
MAEQPSSASEPVRQDRPAINTTVPHPARVYDAEAMLTSGAESVAGYLDADARDPRKILSEAAGMLDLTRPTAVLLLGVLHNITDQDDPHGIVRRLMDAVPAGSYLAI